ncbi:unnamed protein product [Pedinophyceae sp. YPF-701]|nr:unnamed protein product [Pedinophyceae sp. YPF-701]
MLRIAGACRSTRAAAAVQSAAAVDDLARCLRGVTGSASHKGSGAWSEEELQQISSSLQSAFDPSVGELLRKQGFAVADNALPAHLVPKVRNEILGMHARSLMKPNSTHLVERADDSSGGTKTTLLEKQGIAEADAELAEVRDASPLLSHLALDATLRTMLSLYTPPYRFDTHTVKAQRSAGGGACFPVHFDSSAGLDGRILTAIVYCNDSWQPGDGGELRLYPWPRGPVDIPPVAGRIVVFPSMTMPHRVLPSRAERVCFSVWMGKQQTPPPGPPSIPHRDDGWSSSPALWRALLGQPAVKELVLKALLAEEWERSLVESHPPGPGLDRAVEKHRADVGRINVVLGWAIDMLREAGGPAGGAGTAGGVWEAHRWL